MTGTLINTTIDLDFAIVKLRNDGIVQTDINLDDSITLEQAKTLLEAYINVSNGGGKPHLMIPTKFAIPDNDVLDFIKNVGNIHGKADAFIIKSLPQKIIGNFFLKFHKPKIPTKLFSDYTKAIKWLKEYT